MVELFCLEPALQQTGACTWRCLVGNSRRWKSGPVSLTFPAAAIAGLHFTPELLAELGRRGIATGQLTLHVGAGTFQPVKAETMTDHPMHAEPIIVSAELLQLLLAHHPRPVIAMFSG